MRRKTAGGNVQTHPITLKYWNYQYQSVLAVSHLILLMTSVVTYTLLLVYCVLFCQIGGLLSLQSILEYDSKCCYIPMTLIKVFVHRLKVSVRGSNLTKKPSDGLYMKNKSKGRLLKSWLVETLYLRRMFATTNFTVTIPYA